MAPPQAHPKNDKLAEVAAEGFALLDEYYGRGPKRSGARQKNNKLVAIADDGFALLDEFYGRDPRKPRGNKLPDTTQAYDHHHHHNHQRNHHNQQYSCVYWGPQVVTVREPVINSDQAAQFYDGMEIVDHTIRKAIGRAY